MDGSLPASERMAAYRRTALARTAARERELDEHRTRAWSVARRAAEILRETFGATRVAVFGSLAAGEIFDDRSDVDLAAWGIAYDDFWQAYGAVAGLSTAVEVDLVRAEEASERLLAAIETEGIDL